MPVDDCGIVVPPLRNNIVTDLASLENLSGNAKFHCIVCSGCGPDKEYIKWSKNKRFHWAIDLCCLNCKNSWSICQLCNSLRSQLTGYMLTRHNRTKHAIEEAVQNSSNISSPTNGGNDHCHNPNDLNEFNLEVDDVETSSQISIIHPHIIPRKFLPYSNANSTFFFQEEASSNKLGGGATALVTRALTNTDYSVLRRAIAR